MRHDTGGYPFNQRIVPRHRAETSLLTMVFLLIIFLSNCRRQVDQLRRRNYLIARMIWRNTRFFFSTLIIASNLRSAKAAGVAPFDSNNQAALGVISPPLQNYPAFPTNLINRPRGVEELLLVSRKDHIPSALLQMTLRQAHFVA